ncbi:Hypothetical predicted protein [Octopus vulgaris]|uniref:Uncharacterized protein n=1 Tax=Octopus vulgaris TaxID=6645 RepID=A0AA36F1R5_OCTVU|nr:Hypothetical predicted protein [Octopus vulgaris]
MSISGESQNSNFLESQTNEEHLVAGDGDVRSSDSEIIISFLQHFPHGTEKTIIMQNFENREKQSKR